jgi:hypothetical protein
VSGDRRPQYESPGEARRSNRARDVLGGAELRHPTRSFDRTIFVGEPTGGSPNHNSGGGQLELPFLGLHVGMSIGYIQDSRPDDPRLALEPEVRVDLTSADFMAGRDPALEAALRLRR